MLKHSWTLFSLLFLVELFLKTGALPKHHQREQSASASSGSGSKKFGYTQYVESDPEYWYGMAAADLRERLDIIRPIHKRAKNVVFFLGDGMGISTITAARILKGQMAGGRGEEGFLEFDRFPYSALIKTYNLDKQVPDSAGTATAYLTGVKANFYTLGVSGKVNEETRDCALVNASAVSSILQWALDAGKAAGVVTTTRITHATPAASYAHVPDRDWEGSVPAEVQGKAGCKDIASQLVEDYPGNRLSVILGGGRKEFLPKGTFDPKGKLWKGHLEPVEGTRKDGRNLLQEWIDQKAACGLEASAFSYVNNTAGLRAVNLEKTKFLLGLFNASHLEFDALRDRGQNGEPSLTEMTEAAIRVLTNQEGDKGFVLLVEGGRIDHAHHNGYANLALSETVEFERAVRRARELLPSEETLFIVTADHSHGLTINGYPVRGNPISGFAGEDEDHIPYTTLMYATGPGFMTPEQRENKVIEDFNYNKYRAHASVRATDAYHGGEDVAVFSTGPMAHFFGGTHEQSYIAHVVGFAACIGVYTNESHCLKSHTHSPHHNHHPGLEQEWDDNEIVIKEPGQNKADISSRSLRLTEREAKSGSAPVAELWITSWQIFTLILSMSWILCIQN